MNNSRKKTLIAAVLAVLVIVVAVLAFVLTRPKTEKGSKSVTVSVVFHKDNVKDKTFKVRTNAEHLIDVLNQLKEEKKLTFDGDKSQYGLFITSFDGVKADFNKDKTFWAIYVNDKLGQFGVEQQTVTNGDKFRFELSK